MRPKRSPFHYAKSITSRIIEHPSNRDHRARALSRAFGWQAYKRLARRPRDVDYAGFRLRCYPDSNSASNVMYFGERYDWDEMRFMEDYLRPGDGFLDIGANIGTYTLLAASFVGSGGRIDSFEPFPLSATRLRENVALNRLANVTIHEVAVADVDGTVEFLADFDVSNCVRNDVDRVGDVVEVQQVRVDDALGDGGYALAKVDVEGLELATLRGAEQHVVTANPPVWVLEVADHLLRKYGASADELVTWLRDREYDLGVYDPVASRLHFDADAWSEHRNLWAVARASRPAVEERLATAVAGGGAGR